MAKNDEKYAYLNRLSTEQLEDLLQADLDSDEFSDEDVIFHILEVLKQRESTRSAMQIPDVDEAWAEFQKYYNIPEGKEMSLYPSPDEESKAIGSTSLPIVKPQRTWLRRAVVAAAAAAILMGTLVCAQAAGLDVFVALARWTNDTFHFVSNGDPATGQKVDATPIPTHTENHSAIQSALYECGINPDLAPAWFPDGFVMDEPIILHDGSSSTVSCLFTKSSEVFFTYQIDHSDSFDLSDWVYEKDGTQVKPYISNQMAFYLMENLENTTAAWSDGRSTTITIFGQLSADDMKAIIDSIGG